MPPCSSTASNNPITASLRASLALTISRVLFLFTQHTPHDAASKGIWLHHAWNLASTFDRDPAMYVTELPSALGRPTIGPWYEIKRPRLLRGDSQRQKFQFLNQEGEAFRSFSGLAEAVPVPRLRRLSFLERRENRSDRSLGLLGSPPTGRLLVPGKILFFRPSIPRSTLIDALHSANGRLSFSMRGCTCPPG